MKNKGGIFMKKFTSRKFLLALVGDLVGIVTMVFGQNAITTIVGAAAVAFVNIAYCIVEGAIDAKSVSMITDSVEVVAKELGASDEEVDAIGKIGFAVEELVGDGGDDPVEGE
jgi:hypothetical protein